MKKLLILALCAAVIPAYALPTYEPFTEFAAQIASNPTNMVGMSNGVPLGTNAIGSVSNCIDLATGGFTAPGGEVWGNLNFNGTAGTHLTGLDIAVISNATIFTSSALSSLLPSTFPGFPAAGQAITNMVENPAQPVVFGTTTFAASPNLVGNSAVLKFAHPITRPASGVKTLYVSYLFYDAQAGQSGSGNNGRYIALLQSSNLVEGLGSGGAYTNWSALFNTFSNNPNGINYVSYGIKTDGAGAYFVGPSDSSAGNNGLVSTLHTTYATPAFVVSAFVLTKGGAVLDTNMLWLNPATGSFGGPTPPTGQASFNVTNTGANMNDVGGFCLIDRVGSGSLGGVGTNYVANLLIGSTWSYVTGGPEFTTQPPSVNANPGANVTITAAAVAANQTVTYQWQKIVSGSPVNLSDGSGTAGGTATVSGSGTASITLTGISPADAGAFQVVATSSSTAFALTSSQAILSSDPIVTVQPQPTQVNYAGTATFSATVTTTQPTLSFAWMNNGNPLVNGPQTDGSFVSGASGTVAGGTTTLTLTLTNLSFQDNGGSYSLFITNNVNNANLSANATLTVNDPGIVTQPVNTAVAAGGTANLSVVAVGTPTLTYQWFEAGNPLSDTGAGGGPGGSTITGSQTATLSIAGANDANDGSYSVSISGGSGQTTNSASVTLTAADPIVIVSGPQSLTERIGDHLAFVVSATGGALTYQWQFNSTPISGATTTSLVLTNIQNANQGTYTMVVSSPAGTNNLSATLTVLAANGLTLSPANLVVARIGDGVQALSGATGNTLYLDQYTTGGTYVNTIQVPDEGTGKAYKTGSASSAGTSPALLVVGGNIAPTNDAAFQGMLTRSANGQTLDFVGYCEAYPFTGADVSVGGNTFIRGVGEVNAFGNYSLVYTNIGLYNGGGHQFHNAVTFDQSNYWVTGEAGSAGGLKYITPNFEPANGSGIPTVGGSLGGTRVVEIINGNLVFSDAGATTNGLYALIGLPTAGQTPVLLIPETASPMDFAFSPDAKTVYITDNGTFSGTGVQAGGIQRWDTNTSGAGYVYSYTLGTGASSTAGGRSLTVDFSAAGTWGTGVTGAVVYATTAEAAGNRLISIVDTGASSGATTLATASSGSILSGVKFGPAAVPVSIVQQPENQAVYPGSGATFSVIVAGNPPFTYQWQFNGATISGATTSTLTVNNTQAALPGSYNVIVGNSVLPSLASSSATVTFVPVVTLAGNGPGAGWSMNANVGTTGVPQYNFGGFSNVVELTQGAQDQASSSFYRYPVYVGGFLATWTYQVVSPGAQVADGTAFVVQNDARGAAAIGATGGSVGYSGITNSAALEFNIFSGAATGLGFSLNTNGTIGAKTDPSPVVLNNGDSINVTVQYVNGTATVSFLDTVTSNTFTTNAPFNLNNAVGGNYAYIGFTAGDGAVASTQTVSNFVFTPLISLNEVASNGNVTLTWPTNVGGYVLQRNGALGTTNWANSTNVTIGVTNGVNTGVVPIGSTNKFFRLVVP